MIEICNFVESEYKYKSRIKPHDIATTLEAMSLGCTSTKI